MGQKHYKLGQVFQIGANRFQVRVEITNRGKRDFKSGQGFPIGPENAVLKIFWILRLKCSWFVLNYSGQRLCLFICCKTKKKIFFFEKICYLQNIHYLQKKCFYVEKKVLYWKFFIKKTFFTEKDIYENVKIYISHLRHILLCRKCLCYKQKINLS